MEEFEVKMSSVKISCCDVNSVKRVSNIAGIMFRVNVPGAGPGLGKGSSGGFGRQAPSADPRTNPW